MNRSKLVSLAVLVVAAVGLTLAGSATGAEGDAAGVRKGCEAIVVAWNKHDAKAVAAVFTEDADMITADGRLISGRAEIEKSLAADHGGALREASLQVLKEPVRFPTPDVAVSDAEVQIAGVAGPDGAKMPPMTLMVTNVWKKTDGNWLVFASRHYPKGSPAPAK
jgi:uncharacterized protein (TIGR02246 family)